MRFKKLGYLLLGGAAVFAWSDASSSAVAALLYAEAFDYADGNLVNGTNGPNSPNPPFWAAHSGTGTFVQVSGGTISTTAGGGSRQDVNLAAGAMLGQGQTWYAGFDLTVTGDFTLTGATEEYFAHFLQGTSSFTGRVYIAAGQSTGDYALGIVGGSNTPSVKFPVEFNLGDTHRVVVAYTLDPDNNAGTQDSFARLWVDPVNEASPFVTKVANFSNAIEAFAFRQGSTVGAGTQVIDNLQLATTFDEASIIVPEPGTIALLALTAFGLVGSRRRGSK
jgi:hypothetical protein